MSLGSCVSQVLPKPPLSSPPLARWNPKPRSLLDSLSFVSDTFHWSLCFPGGVICVFPNWGFFSFPIVTTVVKGNLVICGGNPHTPIMGKICLRQTLDNLRSLKAD